MIACECKGGGDQCDTCAEIEEKFEKILNEPCSEAGENQTCYYYGSDIQPCGEGAECPKIEKWLRLQEALADNAPFRNEEY